MNEPLIEQQEAFPAARLNLERIFQARRDLQMEKDGLEAALEEVRDRRAAVKRRQNYLDALIGNIERGENPLPFDDPGATDLAGQTDLALALSLTEKTAGLLADRDILTVADLEQTIREDAWWYHKIDGIGESTANDIMDSLVLFRAEHPVPESRD